MTSTNVQLGVARLNLYIDKRDLQVLSRATQDKSTTTLSSGQDVLVSIGEDPPPHALNLAGHDIFQTGFASVATSALAAQRKSV